MSKTKNVWQIHEFVSLIFRDMICKCMSDHVCVLNIMLSRADKLFDLIINYY